MKSIQPYELLIRWDQTGVISGAHVQWREVFTEDEEVIAERLLDAQPLDVGVEGGFPASEIIGNALTDALASLAQRDAEIARLKADVGYQEPPSTDGVFIISKDDIWRRASDQEAEIMEQALQNQPTRLKRIYEGATYIRTDDGLFTLLKETLVQLFGETRADELLAPSI